MGLYRILEPIIYMKGNKAVTAKPTAAAVRLDDDVAKELGDKVQAVGDSAPPVEPEKADDPIASDNPTAEAAAAADVTPPARRKTPSA